MDVPLRVLIVEDVPDDAGLMVRELRRAGFSPTTRRVATWDDMAAALHEGKWDMVLCDYALPGFSSDEALTLIKAEKVDVPCVVVSGRIGEEAVVAAMRAGAHDCVSKDRLARLGPVAQRVLEDVKRSRELKKAEAARAQLAALVAHTDDAIISTTLDGYITTWNPAAERLFGWTALEAIGLPVAIIVPLDASDTMLQTILHVREGRRLDHHDAVRLHKDGSRVDVSITISPIRDEQGSIAGVSMIAQDITERKRAEDALRASEEKYRALIENIPDVVWWADEEGKLTFISPSAMELCGYPPRDIYAGGHAMWLNMIHGDDRAQVERAYEVLFTRHRPFHLDYRLRHKDGDWIWLHDKAVPLFETGRPMSFYGILSDITARKTAEEDRERLIHELQEAMATIKSLRGMLPICAGCKKIRDDRGYWNQIEAYIAEHSGAQFTHGMCPECTQKLYADLYDGNLR